MNLLLTFTHRYQDALVGELSLTEQDTPELTASSTPKTVGLVLLAHSTPIMYQRQPYTLRVSTTSPTDTRKASPSACR